MLLQSADTTHNIYKFMEVHWIADGTMARYLLISRLPFRYRYEDESPEGGGERKEGEAGREEQMARATCPTVLDT